MVCHVLVRDVIFLAGTNVVSEGRVFVGEFDLLIKVVFLDSKLADAVLKQHLLHLCLFHQKLFSILV